MKLSIESLREYRMNFNKKYAEVMLRENSERE